MGLLVFMGWVISWANKWEDDSSYFGEGVGISRNWATAHFRPFMVSLGTVMVLVCVSFSLLMYYSKCIMRLQVCEKSLGLVGSNQFFCILSWVILLMVVPCPLPSYLTAAQYWARLR